MKKYVAFVMMMVKRDAVAADDDYDDYDDF
jgi:hypothetical protein